MSHPHQPPTYDELSDAELTELVRAGAPTALPATEELRRRHRPRCLVYARLCARDEAEARQLVDRAFALAWQEIRRGDDPHGPWRHRLLTLIHRAAADWVAGGRRGRLDDAYASFLDTMHDAGRGPSEPMGPASPATWSPSERRFLAAGFAALPIRTQGLLWHVLVEEDAEDDIPLYVGDLRADLPTLVARAIDACHDSCLRIHLEAGAGTDCPGFGRILDAASRRAGARENTHLIRHLVRCPGCSNALSALTALEKAPRTFMADALLGWSGSAYLARNAQDPDPATATSAADTGAMRTRPGRRFPIRLLPTRAARPAALLGLGVFVALATAAVGGAVLIPGASAVLGADPAKPTAATVRPTGAPTDISPAPPPSDPPTAIPSKSPSPSPSPSRSAPVPTPSVSPSKSRRPVPPKPRPSASGPQPFEGTVFTSVVNAATDLCLTVSGGSLRNGTGVISTPCETSSLIQKWRFDENSHLRNLANNDFCLDARDGTERGVGIRRCADAENGDDDRTQLFLADSSGRIRPRIAQELALEPGGTEPGASVLLSEVSTGSKQRWNAG